jgi:hypothetical protein
MNYSHRSGEKKPRKKRQWRSTEARESDPLLPPQPDLTIRPGNNALRSRRSPPLSQNIDRFSGMSTTEEHADQVDHIHIDEATNDADEGSHPSSAALSEPQTSPLEPQRADEPVVLLDGPVLTDQSSYDAPPNYQSMDPIVRIEEGSVGNAPAPFFVPPTESTSSNLEPRTLPAPPLLSKSNSYHTRTTQNDEPPLLEIPEEIYAVRKAALQVLKPLNKTWVRTPVRSVNS